MLTDCGVLCTRTATMIMHCKESETQSLAEIRGAVEAHIAMARGSS